MHPDRDRNIVDGSINKQIPVYRTDSVFRGEMNMKVKSKKKIIICCCISLILLLLLAAVYIFQFTGLGYRMSVPYRSSFEKVADNIYVNKNYSGNIKEAIQLTEEALERDRAFFGELQCTDTTIIIFCDDDKLLSKLDGDHDTKTSYTKKNYISVSDEYQIGRAHV